MKFSAHKQSFREPQSVRTLRIRSGERSEIRHAAWKSIVAGFCFLPLHSFAQGLTKDPSALQGVGLFEHVCLPFAGHAGNLRLWAANKGLHAASPEAAAAVLSGHAGQVYNASTPSAKLVLMSFDDGACIVVMPSGDKDAVDKTLAAVFRTLGAIVTEVSNKVSPDHKAMQTLDLVTLGNKAWHVSVTSHMHKGDMLERPNVLIMATATP